MSLAALDDLMEAAAASSGEDGLTAEHLRNLPAPWLSNGFYTLTFPDGSHRTFRIRTERSGALVGKRTIALLIGPDNTSDYEGFGFIENSGVKVWKRFQGTRQERYGAIVFVLAGGEIPDEYAAYELLVSRRCFVCNRPLTDAASIAAGMGPFCRERMGQ